jgi:hypothetical protein
VLKVLQICDDNSIKAKAKEQRISKVKEGIRFILRHFEGRQSLFPRKMSTSLITYIGRHNLPEIIQYFNLLVLHIGGNSP